MARKKKSEEEPETTRCDHSWDVILAAGRMTEDEYLFVKGGIHTPEIFSRIEQINRSGGTKGISGVFYALEENRISVAKAMEVVRKFLLSGNVDAYRAATGESELEKVLRDLLQQCAALPEGKDGFEEAVARARKVMTY